MNRNNTRVLVLQEYHYTAHEGRANTMPKAQRGDRTLHTKIEGAETVSAREHSMACKSGALSVWEPTRWQGGGFFGTGLGVWAFTISGTGGGGGGVTSGSAPIPCRGGSNGHAWLRDRSPQKHQTTKVILVTAPKAEDDHHSDRWLQEVGGAQWPLVCTQCAP